MSLPLSSPRFFVNDKADKSDPANQYVAVLVCGTWQDGTAGGQSLSIWNDDWPRFVQTIIDADTIRQMP